MFVLGVTEVINPPPLGLQKVLFFSGTVPLQVFTQKIHTLKFLPPFQLHIRIKHILEKRKNTPPPPQ